MNDENLKPTAVRELTDHKVNECNDKLKIEVLDEPGAGGANHHYGIYGFWTSSNPSAPDNMKDETCLHVLFQNGPIPQNGTNGVTQEALLAIIIDRLHCFQAGPYACRENAIALTHLEDAMHWLHHRTRARLARGVEGTHEK